VVIQQRTPAGNVAPSRRSTVSCLVSSLSIGSVCRLPRGGGGGGEPAGACPERSTEGGGGAAIYACAGTHAQ